MRIFKLTFQFMILCLSLTVVAAQMDCPALVRAALETAQAACSGIGRNELCYGNRSITLTPRENVEGITFEQPGDRVSTSVVETLQLSPLNLSDEIWGIGLIHIQANLPASPSGQNVTLLFFGDAAITNSGEAVQIEARINAPNAINVRSAPTTEGSILATLDPGTVVTVNGRNAAGDWLRVQLEGGSQGWAAARLLQYEADINTLTIVENETASYAPMQAFHFRSGSADAGCAEAPNSGLLVQVPEGAGEARLQINMVEVRLGSTAFLQTADNVLIINTLEGTATISALDKSVIVPAGAVSTIALDDQLLPSEPPTDPFPYALDDLQALPIMLLPRQINIIDPLTQREINLVSACHVVSAVEGITFREGPGTAYFATGTLTVNTPYRVTGQTNGRDGFVWWRISTRGWVRADVVTTTGNCDNVPVTDARPTNPSTSGFSTNLTCTSERIVYANVGDIIPISVSYASSAVPVDAIIAAIFVDGDVIFEGLGGVSGTGIVWNTTWVATVGIHNVEVLLTPTIQIQPDYAQEPIEAGDSWSFAVCQIRVE